MKIGEKSREVMVWLQHLGGVLTSPSKYAAFAGTTDRDSALREAQKPTKPFYWRGFWKGLTFYGGWFAGTVWAFELLIVSILGILELFFEPFTPASLTMWSWWSLLYCWSFLLICIVLLVIVYDRYFDGR